VGVGKRFGQKGRTGTIALHWRGNLVQGVRESGDVIVVSFDANAAKEGRENCRKPGRKRPGLNQKRYFEGSGNAYRRSLPLRLLKGGERGWGRQKYTGVVPHSRAHPGAMSGGGCKIAIHLTRERKKKGSEGELIHVDLLAKETGGLGQKVAKKTSPGPSRQAKRCRDIPANQGHGEGERPSGRRTYRIEEGGGDRKLKWHLNQFC